MDTSLHIELHKARNMKPFEIEILVDSIAVLKYYSFPFLFDMLSVKHSGNRNVYSNRCGLSMNGWNGKGTPQYMPVSIEHGLGG